MLPNNQMPTQAGYIRRFNELYREQFNDQLFERRNEDMIQSIEKIILSCERDKYFTLKVLSMRAVYDYEEIYNMLRDHEESRRKKNDKHENYYDFIDMKDSDIMLLEVKWLIRHNGTEKQKIEGKLVDVTDPEQILTVLICLPRFVNKYYFRLNGVYYLATMQIVDGSTYNNSTSNTSKSDSATMKTMFQPIAMFRMFRDMVDINSGATIRNIVYTSIIFKNHLNAMYYILAAYGLYRAFDFLGIYCVQISDVPNTDPNMYCFKKHNLYVSYPKWITDPMVQSLATTIYDAIQKDTTLQMVYNQRFWLMNLGKMFKSESIDKGLFVLDSVESIYDLITKEDTKLPDSEKGTIYHILRWQMREFVPIRARDNVDVSYKKIRIADYCAAALANKLATGIHRISDMGKRVTLNSVIKAVYTNPMYVIQQIMRMSNLVNYQDMVNDNDATSALKFTYKGIQGLGEDGTSIQPSYRYIDPSHIGILDLDTSSTSDPGMSGMICPMTDLHGKFFSDYQEPNTWYQQWKPQQDEYLNRKQGAHNPISFGSVDNFETFESRDKIVEQSLEITKRRCPIFNIWDPTIKYTDIEEQAIKEATSAPTSRLFTLISEED